MSQKQILNAEQLEKELKSFPVDHISKNCSNSKIHADFCVYLHLETAPTKQLMDKLSSLGFKCLEFSGHVCGTGYPHIEIPIVAK